MPSRPLSAEVIDLAELVEDDGDTDQGTPD